MAKDLGKHVSHTYDNKHHSYDSVVFQKDKPVLDAEINLSQQLLSDLSRKTTAGHSSGWLSYQDIQAEPGNANFFYTQDPSNPLPELALVNGWPVHVTNTQTTSTNVNVVNMDEYPLVSGSRVDGVFLEVWRGLVSDEMSGITTPTDLTQIGELHSISVINDNVAWAVGDNGIVLKTDNGGVTWPSQPSPTSVALNVVKFTSASVGYIAGENGTLFKTDNGGATWTQLTTPVLDALRDISIISDVRIVIVGDNGTILRTENGYEFSLVLNSGSASGNLNSVHFYDKAVGWAVGDNGTYLRTLNGGVSWTVQPITTLDPSNSLQEITVTRNLNAVRFVNLSDGWAVGDSGLILRTTDGGLRWSDISVSLYNPDSEVDDSVPAYSQSYSNLNNLEVLKSYPVRMSLSIKNSSVFASASYEIDPKYLYLSYQDSGDLQTRKVTLNLANYPTDKDLVDAVNELKDSVTGEYIFNASLSYVETAYQAHDSSGTIYGTQSTEVRFSMGDKAWIVGDDGIVLSTQNGGARWVTEDSSTSFNLFGISFTGVDFGWVVGDQGEIAKYSAGNGWEDQDTELVKLVQRKVFFEGNNESPANLNLRNDSVHPDVKKETTARTQIQYRIRVVEGVDISSFRDAGLGSAYVYSRGPNASVREAGSQSYKNMGTETGDFGLWRSICRNTVDGYSYAIPMFLVSRRNQQAYNSDTNINGTSIDAIGAIRPDGLTFEDITYDDVVDIRRKTGNIDAQDLLGKTFDLLLGGKLRTSMSKEPARGGQAGSTLTYVDEYSSDSLDALARGGINAQAIGGITGFASGSSQDDVGGISIPGVSGPPAVAYFPESVDVMYNHDPSYYQAFYSITDDGPADLQGATIPGFFTGMGTSQASFVFGETGVYEGVGVNYVIQGAHINYGSKGLSKIPTNPLQLKNVSKGTPSQSVHFYGIDEGVDSKVVRILSSGIPGYSDYVEASSTSFSGDETLNGSNFRIHFYQEIEENTTELKIPKNVEGYFVFSVRSVTNLVDGGTYRVRSLTDRDGTDTSTLVISLANTFTVAGGSYVEIVAEVCTMESTSTGSLSPADIGQVTVDRGESIDAYRSPYMAIFDSSVKGVLKSLKSVILEKDASGGEITFTEEERVTGVATMNYLDGDNIPTVWLVENVNNSDIARSTVPANSVTKYASGYISKLVGTTFNDSTVLVVVTQEVYTYPNNSGNGAAVVTYKSPAPQTIQPLPASMEVELVAGPLDFAVSSLGTGGGVRSSMFKNPLEQLPLNDSILNSSYFFNLYGLELSSFAEDEGFLTLPFRVSRKPSGVITLSEPSVDRFGRTFYKLSSDTMVFKTEGMFLGNPRKLMVPFLARVKSQITSPALHGELVLAVITSYENTTLENELRVGPTEGKAVVALYKVPGMPIIR